MASTASTTSYTTQGGSPRGASRSMRRLFSSSAREGSATAVVYHKEECRPLLEGAHGERIVLQDQHQPGVDRRHRPDVAGAADLPHVAGVQCGGVGVDLDDPRAAVAADPGRGRVADVEGGERQ